MERSRTGLGAAVHQIVMQANVAELLAVDLTVEYPSGQRVLNGARFTMSSGEILGLVGESGTGKSTLALAILQLLPPGTRLDGSVRFRGKELVGLSERDLRQIRGKQISLILQSPMTALNPALRIGEQLWQAWIAHGPRDREAFQMRLERLMGALRLPTDRGFLQRYPRELSVGMAQRVLIALATLHQPRLLIADEPTSALDLLTQAETLELLAELNRESGIGILFISHDLNCVAQVCDRVAVLHGGEIVECGPVRDVFERPAHPYVKRLVQMLGARTPVRNRHPSPAT